MSKVTGAEIGINDDRNSDESWFRNMMSSFRSSEGTKYIERALNAIEVQKQNLNLIVIIVKPRSDLSFNHYIVRNRNSYIERTELALHALLQCKRDEEEGNFDYLLPHWWNFYCFLPRMEHFYYQFFAFQ